MPYTPFDWSDGAAGGTPITATRLDAIETGIADAHDVLDNQATYNVKDYGAAGDNTADDTAEIQAAIDAAATAGGGVVFFPTGTYRVSVPLLVKDKVRLVGTSRSGVIIRAAASFTGDHVIRLGAGTGIVFGTTVEWMTVDALDTLNYCVYTTEAQELSGVFNCLLTKFRHSGFYGAGGRYFAVDGGEMYGSASGWTYGVRLASVTGPVALSRFTVNSNGGSSALGTAGIHLTSTRAVVSQIHGERCADTVVFDTSATGSAIGIDSTTDTSGHAVRITTGNSGGVVCIDVDSINDEKTSRNLTSYTTFYSVGAQGSTKPVITTEPTVADRRANAQQFSSSITHVRNHVTATTTSATLDLSLGFHQQLTLQSNVTSLTISNNADGLIWLVRLVQDATGSRTVTWPGTFKFAAATAPTLATSANRSDILQFLCMGGNFYEISRSLNLP